MSCPPSNKPQHSRGSQQGAALVIALLVFALAAALMVGVQRDFTLQLQRSTNTFLLSRVVFLLGAESLAELALRLDADEDGRSDAPVDSLLEVWAQPQAPFPLDGIGFLSGDLYDLQGRFNLNGLVEFHASREGNAPAREHLTGKTRVLKNRMRHRLSTNQTIHRSDLIRSSVCFSDSFCPLRKPSLTAARLYDWSSGSQTLSTRTGLPAWMVLSPRSISPQLSLPAAQSAAGQCQ